MTAIHLRTSRAYWARISILWGLFGSMGFALTATARMPALGIFGLVLMLAPAFLLWNRRRTWVARLDSEGVTLLDGSRHAWADFVKLLDVNVLRGEGHSHYELIFQRGRARVFDRMLSNPGEVLPLLGRLARGDAPFA